MRKYRHFILLIIIVCIVANIAEAKPKPKSFDLGKRYIKLGNTYREAGDEQSALKYLNDGLSIVQRTNSWEGKYWTAAGHEYLGYYYRDNNDITKAREELNKALAQYNIVLNHKKKKNEDVSTEQNSIAAVTLAINNLGSGRKRTGNYSKTTVFNFDNNKLKELPQGLPDNATNISLANNKFTNFPGELMRYPGLEYINLANNKIKSLPSYVSELQRLRYLNLDNNKLDRVERGLGSLKNLEVLSLQNNKLKEVPPDLCELQSLKVLNLKNNKIKNLNSILNLIKCLPNTNVLYDEFTLKGAEEETVPAETE